MKKAIPEWVLRDIRQLHDLEPDDTSRDDEFHRFEPQELLAHWLTWNGILGYTSQIWDIAHLT